MNMRGNRLVSLVLAIAVWLGSMWILAAAGHDYCAELPRLTVLATLAAFLIALCFRQLGSAAAKAERLLLIFCLGLAAVTLFVDARIVVRYRGPCRLAESQRQSIFKHSP